MAITKNESRREKGINVNEIERSAATTTAPKTAIIVTI